MFLVGFGFCTVVGPFLGAPLIGIAGTLALTLAPGAVLALRIRQAYEGDRFWWDASLFSHWFITLVLAAVAWMTGAAGFFALLAAWFFGINPLISLLRSGRPEDSDVERRGLLIAGYLSLPVILFAGVWLTELGL